MNLHIDKLPKGEKPIVPIHIRLTLSTAKRLKMISKQQKMPQCRIIEFLINSAYQHMEKK